MPAAALVESKESNNEMVKKIQDAILATMRSRPATERRCGRHLCYTYGNMYWRQYGQRSRTWTLALRPRLPTAILAAAIAFINPSEKRIANSPHGETGQTTLHFSLPRSGSVAADWSCGTSSRPAGCGATITS